MTDRKQEISQELATHTLATGDPAHEWAAYSGPTAEHIERLEERIAERDKQVADLLTRIEDLEVKSQDHDGLYDELRGRCIDLEKRPEPNATMQLGEAVLDTRPGLSVSDVVELTRALRGDK